MFIYVNNSDNSIFYYSAGPVRTDDNMIYGPNEIIRKSSISYTVYEVNGDDINLKYFSENKYIWDADNEVTSYADPEMEIADKMKDIRIIRDSVLVKSDVESDVLWSDKWLALDSDTRVVWTDYRQELRDITNIEDPDTIQWPTHPLDIGGALNPEPEDSA